jgi:hypothetical protein
LRKKIVSDSLCKFERARGEGKKFDDVTVKTVSVSSAAFQALCSDMFLAYPPVLVSKSQTGREEIRSQIAK